MTNCIIFFVKYPTPGEVKTRLAEDSTPKLAAEFYAVFAQEKLNELRRKSKADVLVYYAPHEAEGQMADWLGQDQRYFPQTGDDLGARMENAFLEVFDMGYERAVLVGSDIPGFTSAIATQGLEGLSPDTAAIGPADDGGYYLVGFHKDGFVSEAFHNIPWSTPDVCQQTVNRFKAARKSVIELPRLEDTDTLEDVDTLIALGSLGSGALAAAKKLVGR